MPYDNPDAYSNPGPGMGAGSPPPGMGAMPPGPGPGMPPGPGNAPSPKDVAAMEVEAQQAQLDAILAARPSPEEPYKMPLLKRLEKSLNQFTDALYSEIKKSVEGEVPEPPAIEWDPANDPEGQASASQWEGPFPADLFVPTAALQDLVQNAAGGEYAEKLGMDLGMLGQNKGIQVIAGQVAKTAKTKPFIKALVEEATGGMETPMEGGPSPGPPSGPPSEADTAVVDAMG